MPIQRHTDQDSRLTTLTASGELIPEEFMEVIGAFKDDPPAKNILWDFREASPTGSFDAEDMQQFGEMVMSTIGSRSDGKTALVANSDLTYGIARMYTTHLEFQRPAHQTKVFRSINDALEWLEEGN